MRAYFHLSLWFAPRNIEALPHAVNRIAALISSSPFQHAFLFRANPRTKRPASKVPTAAITAITPTAILGPQTSAIAPPCKRPKGPTPMATTSPLIALLLISSDDSTRMILLCIILKPACPKPEQNNINNESS